MPGVSGVTVVTNARVYYTPRAAAGAPGARHSLRPLFSESGKFRANLARMMRRDREAVSGRAWLFEIRISSLRPRGIVIPGRCEASNPESRDSPMRNCASEVWCFAPSRNDDDWIARSLTLLAMPECGVMSFQTLAEITFKTL